MKKIFFIILLGVILYGFYLVNDINYIKHIEIQRNYIDHPENLPQKSFALETAFGYKNLRADIYWLKTIQYIGANAMKSEYKKYLFQMVDLITELNPGFEKPYTITLLLLPSVNHRYENLNNKQEYINTNNSIIIGKKGIDNFCDKEKIKLIKNTSNIEDLVNKEEYKNPCRSYLIPYYLGYNYFFYKNDPETATFYYKIAAANEDSPSGIKSLSALMQSKSGNREKSYFMFLNNAKLNLSSDDEVCSVFLSNMEELGNRLFIKKTLNLNGKILEEISKMRKIAFGDYVDGNQNECINFSNKMIRELNLKYIEKANEKYREDNNGKNAKVAKDLYKLGYMEYLPIDYQQYEDRGIIYFYNPEIANYDYEIRNYPPK